MTTTFELTAGLPYPLGATPLDGAVNFAVVSEHATMIELCVFDESGHETRLPLPSQTDGIWHGALRGAGPGLVYGLRAHGRHTPRSGHRFNAHKLLLDPYAREIVGQFTWDDRVFGYQRGHPDRHLSLDTRNDAALVPKARVAAPLPGPPPGVRIPAADTILYELHVKGFSQLHPEVPVSLRGTYAGLAHPVCIEHLRSLGVTTLSLMPVHYALTEQRLELLGLRNYWGYNTLGWFCPDPRLSSQPHDPTATRVEFRDMVAALHAAGFEVVLDVVYNHSAEESELGPTLSLRGLDNALYYRLDPSDPSRCINWSGCGNTLNLEHPRVVQLVLDSLRYWVTELGVDGFRFDLAPLLGRTHARADAFDPQAALLVAIEQDPVLARAKLIAEPWDLGPDGYVLGRFPDRFMEWNDRFRDDLRRFWLERSSSRGELARRLAGSNDRFHHGLRLPSASINFITAHDGFTLADLVSYSHKHNLANGELNHDGHAANFSNNCGVEGPTDDPQIIARRARLRRALLASLFVAQGTPMLLAGDELGNSASGNNNAYCQDNPISWLDWSGADLELLAFVRACIELRRTHPTLRSNTWLRDDSDPSEGVSAYGVEWRRPDGVVMSIDDWDDRERHCLGVRMGEHPDKPGDAVFLLFNAEPKPVPFTLPSGRWQVLLDSAAPNHAHPIATATITVAGESILVLAPNFES
jgi:isoamylase